MRERRVRDVVEQPGDPLAAVGTQAPKQQEDPEAMLVSGHVLERERQRRRSGLADALQALERRTFDQVQDRGLLDRDVAIDPVIPLHT